jgi:toxin ParE1/3/4
MATRLIKAASYLADLDQIVEYVERESPAAALALWDAIESRIEFLVQHPHSGRPGRIGGTRELIISHTPYVVGYRIAGNTLTILRVIHGARRWPDDLAE